MSDSLFTPAPAPAPATSAGAGARSTTPPTPPTPAPAPLTHGAVAVTDFAVIESQKENIRPAASGRSAATLSNLFDKADRERAAGVEREVAEGHARWKGVIEEAERREGEGEEMGLGYTDLLDVYNRYVQFNVEHHPSSITHLLPLLERTTRRFTDDARYAQDVRLLKLWTMYARMTERREEIWAFLESRDIGTRHAAFYEEWAGALEALNRRKKADEIYKLGIARRAAPLERLKNRRATFLERIMAPDGVIPEDDPTPPPRPTSALGRAVLGAVSTPAPAGVAGMQSAPSTRVASGAGAGAGSGRSNGSKMAVFSDADVAGGEGAAEADGGVWADVGTRDGRRKENAVEATPWKGEVMPQSARRAPRTPKVEVFKDSTNDENGAAHNADDVFQRRVLPTSEADLIRLDPLRHHTRPATPDETDAESRSVGGDRAGGSLRQTHVPSLPAPPSARKPPRPKKTASAAPVGTPWTVPEEGPILRDSKGRVKERRMYDWEQVYKHGDEWGFAEVRARQRGLLGREWKEVKEWELGWHAPGSTTPQKEKKAVRPPSPTVNTKLANAEVAMMFDQTIHGAKRRGRGSDSDSSDGSSDEDEDEDALPIGGASVPTPLPPRVAPLTDAAAASAPVHPAPTSMLRSTGDMVPPTPSPTGGSGASTGRLNVFADENRVAPAPASARKFNVFGGGGGDENVVSAAVVQTPAKAPLSMRTPLVAAGAGAFGVFREEEPEAGAGAGASAGTVGGVADTPSAVRGRMGALFATPAHAGASARVGLGERPVRRALGFVIPEDREEAGEGEGEQEGVQPAGDGAEIGEEQEEGGQGEAEGDLDADGRRRPGWMSTFNVMTPITERTVEYTTLTQMSRLSLPAQGALMEEEEEEEEEQQEEALPRRLDLSLSTVREEKESGSTRASVRESRALDAGDESREQHDDGERDRDRERREGTTTPDGEVDLPDFTRFVERMSPLRESFDGSEGRAGDDFALPEGFTIHARPLSLEGQAQVQEETHGDASVANDADGVGRTEDDEDTDMAFVTATAGQLGVVDDAVEPQVDVDMESAPRDSGAGEVLRNPCCPIDDAVIETLLGLIQPPLAELPGFVDARGETAGKLDALNRFTKGLKRRSAASGRASIAPDDGYAIELAGKEYEVVDKLGEGGFGAVFRAVDVARRDELDDMSDVGEDDEDDFYVAIKVETPAAIWEAAVLDRIRSRIDVRARQSVVSPRGLYVFDDESFLMLEYASQGTLLDLVNRAQALAIAPATPGAPPAMDEILAVFFTIELLRFVEALHAAGFVHGDIKIDNCLVRLDAISAAQGGNAAWDAAYRRDGSGGWASKGVKVVDFGRAADLTLWPAGEGQRFVADWPVDERDCREVKEGKGWSFQADYAGVAGVVYCLLFGKYIKTELVDGLGEGGKRVKVSSALKRYWQTELWAELFDTLLNSADVYRPATADADSPMALALSLPITNEVARLRGKFEDWLEDNCQKGGKNLRAMLKKVETALMRR